MVSAESVINSRCITDTPGIAAACLQHRDTEDTETHRGEAAVPRFARSVDERSARENRKRTGTTLACGSLVHNTPAEGRRTAACSVQRLRHDVRAEHRTCGMTSA